jgi:hypothetical protein
MAASAGMIILVLCVPSGGTKTIQKYPFGGEKQKQRAERPVLFTK